MDSETIEYPPALPNISSNEADPEDVDDDIGPIPNPVTPDFFIRPDRRQVVYNAEERKVLDAHKERYLASKSVEERKSVAKTYILPAIFQYWDSIGHDIGDSRMQTRKLISWIQNTWRGTKVAETVIAGAAMKRTEVLWQTRKDDVFAEIASLMGLDSASTQTPNWFAFRMKALGNILQHMSALELEQLDRQGETIVSAANQDDDRRQLLAEKNAISRFSKGATGHWNEMGVLSLSFVAYTDSSGKLVVQVHDQMAELMEVDAPLFESEYRPQAHQMKLYVMEYITKMKRILNPGPQPWAPGGTGNDVRDLNLQFDHDGFPILPPGLDTKSGNLPIKKELEDMIRKYLAKHYKLATGGKRRHVPYKQLQKNQARFISPEYLPRGFDMKDPRDLTLPNLISLIDHILARQETHPTGRVFRFSKVNAKRKGYEPIRTHYPDEAGNENSEPEDASDPAPGPTPAAGTQFKKHGQTKAGKARKTNGQNVFRLGDDLLQMSPEHTSDPEDEEHVSRGVDKGKGKVIGPDPDVEVGVVQEAMEPSDDIVVHHQLPQFYSNNSDHDRHIHLNPWEWGMNSGPYPDATYNAGAYSDATMDNSYAAGPSNVEATQEILNADTDDELDDMAYIRNFSAGQKTLYNNEVHYQFPNAHTESFLSNGDSFSLIPSAPWSGPARTDCLPRLNTGPASTSAFAAVPDFSPTIHDQSITNDNTVQYMLASDSEILHSPSIHVTSHSEPPRTKRKSHNVTVVHNIRDTQDTQFNLGSEERHSVRGPTLSSAPELAVIDPFNTNNLSSTMNPGEGVGTGTGTETVIVRNISTAELVVDGAGTGTGTPMEPANSMTMRIVEDTYGDVPKHGAKRVVRTSDILALIESESDRLRVNGPRKRIRKVRE